MTERDELLNFIKCAIDFCNLAAGEGISIDNLSPEDFFFDYSGATGYEDWCTISDYVIDQIERDRLEIERLRKALSECLGTLTGGMDGTWTADSDPISMARAALNKDNNQ